MYGRVCSKVRFEAECDRYCPANKGQLLIVSMRCRFEKDVLKGVPRSKHNEHKQQWIYSF